MIEPDENLPKRKYQWPWVVLAFVILGFALAILFVALAAKKIERQRDDGSPLPASAPAR
jgi:F0F1-type ATP synthase assembly protein I